MIGDPQDRGLGQHRLRQLLPAGAIVEPYPAVAEAHRHQLASGLSAAVSGSPSSSQVH